jgi:hypothetical protein
MTTTTKPKPKRPLTWADITDRERWHLKLAIHEAGHAVAGVVLGAQLRSAVVVNSRVVGVEGLTSFDHDTLPRWRQPEVAYAGPYSQARFRSGPRRPTQRQVYAVLGGSGHKDERALIAAAAADPLGGDSLSQARAVVPLIERCWPAVVRVAQLLHRDGEVTQDDVLAALGVDDGGGLTSTQLAGIRSGCRSVPPITDAQRASASTKTKRQPVPTG